MNIQLDDNWSIETDRFCFVLKNQYKSEKGKLYNNITYHPTIAKALKAYVSESTKECLSVNGILLKLEELEFKIDHLELPTLRQAQLRADLPKIDSTEPFGKDGF